MVLDISPTFATLRTSTSLRSQKLEKNIYIYIPYDPFLKWTYPKKVRCSGVRTITKRRQIQSIINGGDDMSMCQLVAYPICIHMCHGQNLNNYPYSCPLKSPWNPLKSPWNHWCNSHLSAEQHLHWLHRAASWQVHKPNPDGGKVIILLRLLDEVGAWVPGRSPVVVLELNDKTWEHL